MFLSDAEKINLIQLNLNNTLTQIDTPVPSYRGKVRDIFDLGDELLIVTTDRVSAFDCVLGTVPFKGQFLTEQAVFWLEKSREIIDNHLLERTDPRSLRCKKCVAIPIEMVVRGYIAGSLAREPPTTRGSAYGLRLDPALKNYDALDEVIVTPTTKAAVGFKDEATRKDALVARGVVSAQLYDAMQEAALALFKLGSAFAATQDLILVDTKYEFGLVGDKLLLIDEIHSADSSRYWIKSSYATRMAFGHPPDMLDKERLRTHLITSGVDPNHPEHAKQFLTDAVKIDLSLHYWKLAEMLTGSALVPNIERPVYK